jgi:hypothetical protein
VLKAVEARISGTQAREAIRDADPAWRCFFGMLMLVASAPWTSFLHTNNELTSFSEKRKTFFVILELCRCRESLPKITKKENRCRSASLEIGRSSGAYSKLNREMGRIQQSLARGGLRAAHRNTSTVSWDAPVQHR